MPEPITVSKGDDKRLVIVSNRVAMPKKNGAAAGGLAVGDGEEVAGVGLFCRLRPGCGEDEVVVVARAAGPGGGEGGTVEAVAAEGRAFA